MNNSVVHFSTPTKERMRIASFAPRCTWFPHAMGLNPFQQSMRTLFTRHYSSSKNGIELLYLTKSYVTCKFE